MRLVGIKYELQAEYECVPTKAKQKRKPLIIRKNQ